MRANVHAPRGGGASVLARFHRPRSRIAPPPGSDASVGGRGLQRRGGEVGSRAAKSRDPAEPTAGPARARACGGGSFGGVGSGSGSGGGT
mmetsp:Transcript_13004/g.41572  ORF Transcript_13004/g.41572 Transcript_13004/m.41572 type:complete len:90 (+) Transcript_13004:346-615(+)